VVGESRYLGPGQRFQLVEKLGSGGFGRVWRAYDTKLKVDVAVKELVTSDGADPDERSALVVRARREAENLAKLRDHPNIVTVHDIVVEAGLPWIVMQLVVGESLDAAIRRHGPLARPAVERIALRMTDALIAAHGLGILHRDVKPANIVIAPSGQVVLVDFGIAVADDDTRLTAEGGVVGTYAYTAPERFDNQDRPESDVFSLGVTLYHALEGWSPFSRDSHLATMRAVTGEYPPQPRNAGHLTPLLEGMLAKEPERRITLQDARRMLAQPPGVTPMPPGPTQYAPGASPPYGPPPKPHPRRPPPGPVPPSELSQLPTGNLAPAGPPAGGRSLDDGRRTLLKGETVTLARAGEPPLTKVLMAFGWEPAHQSRPVDLDAGCVLYDSKGKDLGKVWYLPGSRSAAKGSVRHTGGSLAGQFDDAVIRLSLGTIPLEVSALVFAVNSVRSAPLDGLRRIYCRLVDEATHEPLALFTLPEADLRPSTGAILCVLRRVSTSTVWRMTAVGEFHDGKNLRQMVAPGRQYL
jgi:serine/threonine protein kinase